MTYLKDQDSDRDFSVENKDKESKRGTNITGQPVVLDT